MRNSVLARTDSGEVQLTITIPSEEVKAAFETHLKEVTSNVTVPGFRKGKAPKDIAEERVDKNKIYEEVLQEVIPHAYLAALDEHKVAPIVSPKVELLKAKEGEDWEIRATTCEKPTITLGKYKEAVKDSLAPTKLWTPDQKIDETKEQKEDSLDEKIQRVIAALVDKISFTLPHVLIDDEINRAMAHLLTQTEKLGLTIDQYLASTNKTASQLREEYREKVTNDLKTQFILNAIVEEEKIQIEDDEVEALIGAAGDEKIREDLSKPEGKVYLKAIIARRKVLDNLAKL